MIDSLHGSSVELDKGKHRNVGSTVHEGEGGTKNANLYVMKPRIALHMFRQPQLRSSSVAWSAASERGHGFHSPVHVWVP